MKQCRICDEALDSKIHRVREMYFGMRDEFEYRQCPSCGCLQIDEIPEDLGKYYPSDYYSKAVRKQYSTNPLLRKIREFRLKATLEGNPASFLLTRPKLPDWVSWVEVDGKTRILDVGCGAGKWLLRLEKKGFRNLEGVDPFIDETIHYACGITILKKEIWDLAKEEGRINSFDLLTMHHSLEHIHEQHESMAAAHALLKDGGKLLVRIPICSSWAWEHYKVNWVQLDAPRHLFLHSAKSIERLARAHGFKLERTIYDSTEFQFKGSEKYLQDIPLIEEPDLFSKEDIAEFKQRAVQLNQEGKGDQAGFVFSK
ncbi:MAG: class I SAM-dependent methyltransferase [Planctomycetota bacterium]|jgi:2-polyprenyl-3-methyl-5-hydroxy-6-metoxy-1,4-benzoquinol methylase